MALPHSFALSLQNKNFLENTNIKNKGKKILAENLYLDKKIKTTKSILHLEKFEKDYQKSLDLKKMRLSAKPKIRSKTLADFFPHLNGNDL